MSSAGLSYGLNITKKKPFGSGQFPRKHKTIFDDEDDAEVEDTLVGGESMEEIGELGGIEVSSRNTTARNRIKSSLSTSSSNAVDGKLKRPPTSVYGDLSSTFTSKKHATAAEELDASIYDYDAVYESLKPQKKATISDQERKPKYMSNLLVAAAIRKRDATIAEEKKLAREREAEGTEYADKEKFVTSAYKKQQEENRRLEEEERAREEREQKTNKGKGMTNFYKNVLEKEEQRHAEVIAAVSEARKSHPTLEGTEERPKTEAELAREITAQTGDTITLNDEGQVVDKRQLLKGGLNILPRSKAPPSADPSARSSSQSDRPRGSAGFAGAGGGKQAMRERQSRMMEAQLEQATKRALEVEEEENAKVERGAKSRKTEGEIQGARERFLARKREAEEARRRGES